MAKSGNPKKGQSKTGKPKRDRSGDVGFQEYLAFQKSEAEKRRQEREQRRLEEVKRRANLHQQLIMNFFSQNQRDFGKDGKWSSGTKKHNSPFFQHRGVAAVFRELLRGYRQKMTLKSFGLRQLVKSVGGAAPDDPAMTIRLLIALEEILKTEVDKLALEALRDTMLGFRGIIGSRFLDPPDEPRIPDSITFLYGDVRGNAPDYEEKQDQEEESPISTARKRHWIKPQKSNSLSKKGILLSSLFAGKAAAGIQPVRQIGPGLFSTFTYGELESIVMESPSKFNSVFLMLEYGTGIFAKPGPRRWAGASTPYKLSPALIQASLTGLDLSGNPLDTARWV